MDAELRELHLNAGRKAGEARTCGTKIRYPAFESAQRAAESMNAKPKTRSTLEAYPCPFCETWHIGRAMSIDELRSYVDAPFTCRHAPLSLPREVEQRLATAYAEPQRAYHTAAHIQEVLRWFDAVHDAVGWHDAPAVYLAVLFHDVVYDPTRHDNEARSAALAEALMHASAETTRLILLTAQHGKLDPAGIDHDAAHFLDSDTAILGAPAAAFDAYDAAVRVEYQHVPLDAYRAGRGAFLRSMLERDRIFFTDFFHTQLDARARDNLARALARL